MAPPSVESLEESSRLLGVAADAPECEIVRVYKRLALKFHPDKNPDAPEQAEVEFKRITHAYELLREARSQRSQGGQSQRRSAPTSHFEGCLGSSASTSSTGICFDKAHNVFDAFFRGGPAVQSVARSVGAPAVSDPLARCGTTPLASGGRGGWAAPDMLAVPCGTGIIVRGLGTAERFNGKAGRVLGWNGEAGRYDVQLECQAPLLSLRRHNFTQRCSIEVVELPRDSDVSLIGEIFSYDEDQGRYMVLLHDPPVVVGLLRGNCLLKRGTSVITRDLSCEQLNGQMAQIVDIDRAAGRYTVRCQSGRHIKVRYDKVLC